MRDKNKGSELTRQITTSLISNFLQDRGGNFFNFKDDIVLHPNIDRISFAKSGYLFSPLLVQIQGNRPFPFYFLLLD
jgi:hypothetical protein